MRTENELVLNKPIHLMTLPSGTKMEARALPICDALAWSESADAAHEAYGKATQETDRKGQADALLAIVDIVADYPWAKPNADGVKSQATSEQVIHAFYELININDPFMVVDQREKISQNEQMESAKKIMEMLPAAQRDQILAKQFGEQLKE